MKTKIKIISILIVLTLITGCAQLTTIQTKLPGMPKQNEATIFASTQSIMTNAKNPIEDSSISDKYEFTPLIEVANLGNADSEGVVCLSGLNDQTFKDFLGCDCQDFTVYADENDGEVIQELEFGPYRINTEEPTEEIMTVTTRYTYETTGYANVCVKKDMYSQTGCQTVNIANQPKNLLTKSTSGAIKITKVTENIIPIDEETVTLSLNVEVGKATKGNIYDYMKAGYPSCRSEEKQNKIVRGTISGLPNGDITCDETELNEDGEGTLTCDAENIRLSDKSGQAVFPEGYSPEIEINLKYGYEQISSIKFNVIPE